ncbi:MAG: 2-hydroxyacid dehydrogenase [Chitinophagaceae bacterium]
MKTLFYSTKDFEQPCLDAANAEQEDAVFIKEALSLKTAGRAKGFDAISIFTEDDASSAVLEALHKNGVRFIAIRAAGYDNVDIKKAMDFNIAIANTPDYSPYTIAEHAVTLILALNRKIITSDKQVHQQNFTAGNLIGLDLHVKTVGIIGAGKIGSTLAKIMQGFGCRLLIYDIKENTTLKEKYGLDYVDLPALCREANIISINTNLTPHTKYLINKKLISLMQRGVMLINTSSGECVNTADVIAGLENGHIGYYGADVYENEKGIFFYDHTGKELKDEMLKKLLAMPNVLITPHQAFITEQALNNIARATFYNIDCWKKNHRSENELTATTNLAETSAFSEYEEL